ncbi:MAG TPA: CsgG/HfaB family protein [Gemmatimonadaceae bacterium]|nr:CsgG/HfaB family protein [Gemmatimonadaceae bacterium]
MFGHRTLVTRVLAGAAMLAAAAVPAGVAAAQEQGADARPTMAVVYFTNGAIGKAHEEFQPLSLGLADMMITELAANPKIRVVERDRINQLMDEQKLSAGDRVDPSTAVAMGKLLGAHHILIGTYVTDTKGRMVLAVRSVNTETSQVEYTETVRDKSDNVLDMVATLAEKVNKGLNLPSIQKRSSAAPGGNTRGASQSSAQSSAESAPPPAARRQVPFQAVMLYSKGLAAKDKGNWQEAAQLFRASLQKFPEYEAPKKALEGIPESARTGE